MSNALQEKMVSLSCSTVYNYVDSVGGVHSVHWTSSAGPKYDERQENLSSTANEVRAFRTFFLFDVFDLIRVEKYIKICT